MRHKASIATRLHVIYNGIDGRNDSAFADGLAQSRIGLPPDAFLIATIGQICLRKGQDVFAQAAVLVAGEMPTAHFLLIGERYSAKPESVAFDESIDRSL